MPFIEAAIAEAQEDQIVPEGEYDLEIITAEPKLSKKAEQAGATQPNMIAVMLSIRSDDYPQAAPVFHHIMLVTDPTFQWNRMYLRDMKRFLVTFSVPHEGNGFNSDDLPGCTGRCLIKVDQNDRGEDVNVLSLPKIATEEKDNGSQRQARQRGAASGRPTRRH